MKGKIVFACAVFMLASMSMYGITHELYHVVSIGYREPVEICFMGVKESGSDILGYGAGWVNIPTVPDFHNRVDVLYANEIGATAIGLLSIILFSLGFNRTFNLRAD